MRCSALCISGLVDDFTFWHLGVGSIDVGAVLQQQIYQLRTWGEVCWQLSLTGRPPSTRTHYHFLF